ncbi:uncharacterized protein LOC106156453 [Lingula anatina]|uniref:Uncharacterized protein LOC106156453 n=1 Tax=Lingula anatina TaxID=7574 RepID=A0A1S3HMC5_LINAN|nr:uncharacterized protein LOC106156453 [Lingula anatina]|eukprot:XP_013387162.1 uncharacterized protein LOC106156453 [Lingula anatina]
MSEEVFIPKEEENVYQKGEDEKILTNMKLKVASDDSKPRSLTRSEILDFGSEGFLLHGILSQQECQEYIQEFENEGFGAIPELVKNNYRSCERLLVQSSALASHLWDTIKTHVEDIEIHGDPHQQHIHGLKQALQGRWKPYGLNELFRICKYQPGGHFAPHFDGHFVSSSEKRSMKTFMIYLNDDFTGGTTNFVDESQQLHMDSSGKYCAEEKNVIHRVQPETGMAIIFNHHRLHEGERIKSGVKYIMRTDIMYHRVEKMAASEQDEMAIQLLQEAERLEAQGKCAEAAELYRKAFKLSPNIEDSFKP